MGWISNLRELVKGVKDLRTFTNASLSFDYPWTKTHGVTPDISNKALIDRYADWGYVCASRNATSVASTPLKLFATRGTGESPARRASRPVDRERIHQLKARPSLSYRHRIKAAEDMEEILEHPFLELMEKINENENGFETLEKTTIFLECTGNAYWLIGIGPLGIPDSLYVLPSQWTKVLPGKERLVEGYLYGQNTLQERRLEEDQVVHFKYPNPRSLYYGLGCIQAAVMAVDRQKAMDEEQKAQLDNHSVPAGTIRYTGGKLDPKVRKDVEEDWNSRMSGPSNRGKIHIFDQQWEFVPVGLTPQEMGFEFGRKWTRTEIAAAFGVPIALIEVENVNRANAFVALEQYTRYTVLPRLTRLEQKINEKLIPLYNEPRLFVAFDNPVLRDEDFELKRDQVYLQTGVITVNEVRQRDGKEPVEWGDEPVSVPQQGFPPITFGGMNGDEQPKAKSVDKSRAVRWQRVMRRREPLERKMDRLIVRFLSDQEREVADNMRAAVGKSLSKADSIAPDAQILVDAIFNTEQWDAELKRRATPLLQKVYLAAAEHALSDFRLDADVVSTEAFEALLGKQLDLLQEVNQTTRKRLMLSATDIYDAVLSGESAEDAAFALEQHFADVFDTAGAMRIARTEIGRAYSAGGFKQMQAAGIKQTEWLTSRDSAVRDSHAMLDGDVAPIGQRFANGCLYPCDPDADPGETINCRCVTVPA